MVPIAKAHGARIVIVNDAPTEMDDLADAVLRGPLGDLLPTLLAQLPPLSAACGKRRPCHNAAYRTRGLRGSIVSDAAPARGLLCSTRSQLLPPLVER